MIKIAIVGYGNLGRACERIAHNSGDFETVGIFTRRNPDTVKSDFGTPVYSQRDIESFKDETDVACICTGSANDVTDLGIRLAKNFNTVDSFDTHAKMSAYFEQMDNTAKQSGKLCFVGMGWDPGLFSLMRGLCEGILPFADTQTFWGRGVSQGHSEAIRRIEGVVDAKQYTVPKDEALRLAREGKGGSLKVRDKHLRECFVVAEEDADKAEIERKIVSMPDYFEPYDTVVHFIDEEEFKSRHSAMPHAGFVLRSGEINGARCNIEFSLKLDSNPDFTAAVLMAYAKANANLAIAGETGAKSILDIPASALLGKDRSANVGKFV